MIKQTRLASRELESALSLDRARLLLAYNIDTGVIIWRVRATHSRAPAGSKAGCLAKDGYLIIGIIGRLYLAHRIAWFLHYGRWPVDQVDHRNGVRDDNRIENLRECSNMENKQNGKLRIDNTSGYIGVSYNRSRGKFISQIKYGGSHFNLGYFDSPEKASAAYLKAKKRLHAFQPIPRP